MVFAMFLGAGNLIFPPMAGQMAGQNLWPAAAGFLMTGVGLPLLGVVMICKVGGGFNETARELPRALVVFMGSCIFTIVVPLYGVPRTAMVAYEIGITPFLAQENFIPRLLFSILFFSISWYLSLRPGKLLESVGEIITPALIILLIIMGISPILMPLGTPGEAMKAYNQAPALTGFIEGYMTMDALAALMFGVVIVTNLKSHGITDKTSLYHYSIITGFIAATGLTLVYLSLFYLGATSRDLVPEPGNGGQILAMYVEALFGTLGSVLLAGVVTLACLTTAIGCITAASEYFDELTDKISYSTIVALISIACMVFANLGLNQIIVIFIPVLMILYPICIMLIFLGLIRELLPNQTLTYRATLLITFIISILDALKSVESPTLETLLTPFSLLPGYESHLSWLLPAAASVIITGIIGLAFRSRLQEDQI